MMRQITPGEREVKEICDRVQTKLGLKFGHDKVPLIMSRLGKRLRDLKLDAYTQYIQLLNIDPDEETVMLNLLTTNVTTFFREPWQFHFLVGTVFPLLQRTKRNQKVRCWSAGCATGEEAYTLGMLLMEHFPADWDLKVLASDVCTASLQYGAEGLYTQEQLRDVPKALLSKYFIRQNAQTYKVSDALRKTVVFRQINLIDEQLLPSRIQMDFTFCRNVFIYFSKETQKQIIRQFYQHLSPGGHLFLGHSESIETTEVSEWKALKGCVYQKCEA